MICPPLICSAQHPKRRTAFLALWAVAVAAGTSGCAVQPESSRSEIVIDGPRSFPESITSTQDGTIITGSVGSGGVFRAAPGAAVATQWIAAGDNGLLDTFGVLADEASNILWVCSSRLDPAAPGQVTAEPAVFRYDLKTGAFRSKHPLPGGSGLCNDIAIGPDKAAYVADTAGGRVLRLAAGSQELEQWSTSQDLEGADGLAFQDRLLFVNSFTSGKLMRIELKADGSAGIPAILNTSRALTRPDGMRRLNATQFVLAEGGGSIDLLTIKGDTVDVRTLRSGLVEPAGVTIVGNTLWALESKLSLRDKTGADPAPFKAYGINLPSP
jgi:hypothetical protein